MLKIAGQELGQKRLTRLETMLGKAKGLRTCILEYCVSNRKTRAVFIGKLQGKKVVFKAYFGKKTFSRVLAHQEELGFITPYMNSGPYQVNRLVDFFPNAGIVVLEFVEGQDFGIVLSESSREKRVQLIDSAGKFINRYTTPRMSKNYRFNARAWMVYLESLFDSPPLDARLLEDADDLQLTRDLLAVLDRQSQEMDGLVATKSAIHGDFSSRNLIYQPNVLIGIDIERAQYGPVAEDASRFLALLQTTYPLASGPTKHGIACDDYEAMANSGALEKEEMDAVLPFIIGTSLFNRFYLRSKGRPHLQIARTAVVNYIRSFAS